MRVAAATIAALLLLTAGPAWAATLSVSPIRLVLTPGAPLGSFTVVNEGGEAARVQLTMNSWRQEGGKDVLTPTRDVLVNPTIFEVGGNSRQLVRLGLQVPAGAVERSYRLIIDEVPTAAQIQASAIGVRLRILVPLFVPVTGAKANLAWRASVKGQDLWFDIANSGARHGQVTRLKIVRPNGKTVFDGSTSVYILPGASTATAVRLSGPVSLGERLAIEARTDDGEIRAAVIVASP